MAEQAIIEVEARREAVVARILERRLDHKTNDAMKQQVAAAAGKHPGKPMILDLSNLDFVRSETMGAFVELRQTLAKSRQIMMLAGVSRQMRATFAVTNLDKRIEIHDTVESALARFAAKPAAPPRPEMPGRPPVSGPRSLDAGGGMTHEPPRGNERGGDQ